MRRFEEIKKEVINEAERCHGKTIHNGGTLDLDEMKKAGLIQDYKFNFDKKGRVKGVSIIPYIFTEEITVNIGFTDETKGFPSIKT